MADVESPDRPHLYCCRVQLAEAPRFVVSAKLVCSLALAFNSPIANRLPAVYANTRQGRARQGNSSSSSAYLTQFNLLADLMCAHHDRKNVDALRGEGIPGAVLNALALGYHALLSRRYNVAPVGIHACKRERERE